MATSTLPVSRTSYYFIWTSDQPLEIRFRCPSITKVVTLILKKGTICFVVYWFFSQFGKSYSSDNMGDGPAGQRGCFDEKKRSGIFNPYNTYTWPSILQFLFACFPGLRGTTKAFFYAIWMNQMKPGQMIEFTAAEDGQTEVTGPRANASGYDLSEAPNDMEFYEWFHGSAATEAPSHLSEGPDGTLTPGDRGRQDTHDKDRRKVRPHVNLFYTSKRETTAGGYPVNFYDSDGHFGMYVSWDDSPPFKMLLKGFTPKWYDDWTSTMRFERDQGANQQWGFEDRMCTFTKVQFHAMSRAINPRPEGFRPQALWQIERNITMKNWHYHLRRVEWQWSNRLWDVAPVLPEDWTNPARPRGPERTPKYWDGYYYFQSAPQEEGTGRSSSSQDE